MMDNVLNFKYNKGTQEVFPKNDMVKSWLFTEDEHDEAALAHYMSKVAEKNGVTINELSHIFPNVLRMLKSDIPWSK